MVKLRRHNNRPVKEKQIVNDKAGHGHELRLPPTRQKKIINEPKEDFDDETVVESDSESIGYLDDENDDAVELYENESKSACASQPGSFFKIFLFLFIIILFCILAVPFAEPLVMAFAPSQCKYPTAVVAFLGSIVASVGLRYL